jgi:hypothetical protein
LRARDHAQVRRTSILIPALIAGLAIAGSACGDDDSAATTTISTTTTTTIPGPVSSASEASCAARDELRQAISDLSKIDVVRNGTSALTDALAHINAALGEVRSTAGADVQPQVDAFQQSLDQLQTALGGGASQIAAIVQAVRDVATTGATLLTSLGNLRCP